MLIRNKKHIFLFFLISILPISIILGSTISLLNIIVTGLTILLICYFEKKFLIFKNEIIIILLFLCIYLVFNTLISIDHRSGLARNLGFFRFILLFIFINYLFYINSYKDNFLYVWTGVILILIFDIFIEFYLGKNIFGWGAIEIDGEIQPDGSRVVSFFKDEPIAGSFLAGFILIIFGHLLKNFNKKKYIPLIFLFISILALLATGERSNTIKIFLGILIFFFFVDFIKFKTKLFTLVALSVLFFVFISKSEYLKLRYFGQFLVNFSSKEKTINFLEESQYFKLYRSGLAVFKNYPIFGVGNKNYRIETCKSKTDQIKYGYECTTHPHQIYIEMLSENGLVGTLVIIGIIFYLMYKILRQIFLSRNYIQVGSFVYIIVSFTPLLPSGSFFSDFNLTLFWINFSIMFGCSKETNLFAKYPIK